MFPFYFEGENLFVEMAGDGFVIAVKYMYDHDHKDANLVQDVFANATLTRRTEVLEFLLGTGRVSLESFNTAFETAASSGSFSFVMFLYEKHFASLQGIYRAFEKAGSLAVTKFLLENTCAVDYDHVSERDWHRFYNLCNAQQGA